MKHLMMLAPIILFACGTQETAKQTSSSNGTDDSNKESSHIDYQSTATPPKSDVTVQYEKVGEQYAIALNDQSLLPVCDKSNDRQLAYTREENKFFTCTASVWTELDVHGQAGAAGIAGKAGVDGKNGTDGSKGEKGDKGDDGKPVDPNQWFDPITQNNWLLGVIMTSAQVDTSPDVCSNGWRLASQMELATAIQHGYGLAVDAQSDATGIWTSTNVISNGVSVRALLSLTGVMNGACTPTDQAIAGNHCPVAAIACLKVGG